MEISRPVITVITVITVMSVKYNGTRYGLL